MSTTRTNETSNTENKNKSPKMTVLIKDTKPEEGICGHASIVIQKGDKKFVTSFEPGSAGLLNAFSVPVNGVNATNPAEDKEQADRKFVKTLSEEEYKKVKEAQKSINKKIEEKEIKYAFSGSNTYTNFLSGLFGAFGSSPQQARKANETHQFKTGVNPIIGDMFAEVSVAKDVKAQKIPKAQPHNCVTTTSSIVAVVAPQVTKQLGIFATPSFLGDRLAQTPGFAEKTFKSNGLKK